MKNLVLVIVPYLLSCTSTPTRRPAAIDADKMLTFARLLEEVKSAQSQTVEQALAAVTPKYNDYFKMHTWVYDSFSLHETSLLDPRAIVYGPEARFVVTFNGSAGRRGGYGIETMEFDGEQFLFREIAFKSQMKGPDLAELTADEIEYQDERIRVSKPNIAKCTQCHGSNPSPIWETYFLWPGVYGSVDDILTSMFHRHEVEANPNYREVGIDHKFEISLGRQVRLKPGFKDVEFKGFAEFIKQKPNHPRYRFVPNRAMDTGFVRYNAGEKPENIDVSEEVRTDQQLLNGGYRFARPNLALNDLLYQRSIDKLWRQIELKGTGVRFLYKLFYAETCVEGFDVHSWNDPLAHPALHGVFSAQERAQIASKAGPWYLFYQKFLVDELNMENEKIDRIERTFGKGRLEAVPNTYFRSHPKAWRSSRTRRFYNGFVLKLPSHFKFLENQEFDDPPFEALEAYVAKGMGIDLKEYATNMRRVATFREGGFRRVYERLFGLEGSEELSKSRDKYCALARAAL